MNQRPHLTNKYIAVIFRQRISRFFVSSRRRHTRWTGDWSSDVCSSDLALAPLGQSRRIRFACAREWERDLDEVWRHTPDATSAAVDERFRAYAAERCARHCGAFGPVRIRLRLGDGASLPGGIFARVGS